MIPLLWSTDSFQAPERKRVWTNNYLLKWTLLPDRLAWEQITLTCFSAAINRFLCLTWTRNFLATCLADSSFLCFSPAHSTSTNKNCSGYRFICRNRRHRHFGLQCSPGNDLSLLTFLLLYTNSLTLPGDEPSLLIAAFRSLCLVLLIQDLKRKYIRTIDLSAEIDIGLCPETNHHSCFSAGIYEFLRLTFPQTFFAVCWHLIPLL